MWGRGLGPGLFGAKCAGQSGVFLWGLGWVGGGGAKGGRGSFLRRAEPPVLNDFRT